MLAREVLRAAHLADRLDSLRPDAGLLHGALPFARRGAAGSDKGCRALALGRAVTSRRGRQRPATCRYAPRGSETSTASLGGIKSHTLCEDITYLGYKEITHLG
jgi:hypothetical protein